MCILPLSAILFYMIKGVLLLIFSPFLCVAQNLTFTYPSVFLDTARSDKSLTMAKFDQDYFVAWKDPGNNAGINICLLDSDEQYSRKKVYTIEGTGTSFAPFFCATPKALYLFWISNTQEINYTILTDNIPAKQEVFILSVKNPVALNKGITACYSGNKLLIASQTKDKPFLTIASIRENGLLNNDTTVFIKKFKTSGYPYISVISEDTARIVWPGYKESQTYYADYEATTSAVTTPTILDDAPAENMASIYDLPGDGKSLYLWKTAGKENRLQYKVAVANGEIYTSTYLPAFFSTSNPPAFCNVDYNNFLLAYTGTDNKFYLSTASTYNPAKWMEQTFFPAKENYSLKDIVIPGSHDAGMSVLTGTGGSATGLINECNTLTQVYNIEQQLNAGIRMFDLRVGLYKGELYTKHSPSDCMEDAVAGGYGEKLGDVLKAVKKFLMANSREIVILSFSHFCNKHMTIQQQAENIAGLLGSKLIFHANGRQLNTVALKELAGKVIISFEGFSFPELGIEANTMTDSSGAFFNYKRRYAATRSLDSLIVAEKNFFQKEKIYKNDLVRLDWQLTEAGKEAAFICNDFQSGKSNPIVDGAILLINTINKHKTIMDLAFEGAKSLPLKIYEWLGDGTITKVNKPNILYVDVAGTWITDFCIDMNNYPF